MRSDLISLKIQASRNLMLGLVLSGAALLLIVWLANIFLIYKFIILTATIVLVVMVSYHLIWPGITQCDLLLLINSAVIWENGSSILAEIKSIQNIGAWLIQIKLQTSPKNQIKQLILSSDSIDLPQFKSLLRYARWKTTKKP